MPVYGYWLKSQGLNMALEFWNNSLDNLTLQDKLFNKLVLKSAQLKLRN